MFGVHVFFYVYGIVYQWPWITSKVTGSYYFVKFMDFQISTFNVNMITLNGSASQAKFSVWLPLMDDVQITWWDCIPVTSTYFKVTWVKLLWHIYQCLHIYIWPLAVTFEFSMSALMIACQCYIQILWQQELLDPWCLFFRSGFGLFWFWWFSEYWWYLYFHIL